jgi:hypothetical protein
MVGALAVSEHISSVFYLAKVFVIVSHFHSCLIFEGKAGAYPTNGMLLAFPADVNSFNSLH